MSTVTATRTLATIELIPSELGTAAMILTDMQGRDSMYQLNQDALNALFHQVFTFAASNWQNRPDKAIETANGIIRSFPAQQVLSMQAISPSDVAVRIDLGNIEMAFLIPVPGMNVQH